MDHCVEIFGLFGFWFISGVFHLAFVVDFVEFVGVVIKSYLALEFANLSFGELELSHFERVLVGFLYTFVNNENIFIKNNIKW